MTKFLIALTVGAVVVGAAGLSTEAAAQTKFYDQQGGFRGYAWCHKAGMDIVDCNYFNLAQCQATNAGFGPAYCVGNPFTPAGPSKPARRKKSRSY